MVPAEKRRELENSGIRRLNNSSKLFHQKLVKFNRELRNSGIRRDNCSRFYWNFESHIFIDKVNFYFTYTESPFLLYFNLSKFPSKVLPSKLMFNSFWKTFSVHFLFSKWNAHSWNGLLFITSFGFLKHSFSIWESFWQFEYRFNQNKPSGV